MKKVLLFCYLLCTQLLFAQTNIGLDTINRYDAVKSKTGVWLEEVALGMRIGKYESGKRTGIWEMYSNTGSLIGTEAFINGKKVKTKALKAKYSDKSFQRKLELVDSITIVALFNNQKDIHQKISDIKPVEGVTTTIYSIKHGVVSKEATFNSGNSTEQKFTLQKNTYSLITFEKQGYILQKVLIDFKNIDGFPSYILPWKKTIPIRLNEKVNTELYSLSSILNKPNQKLNFSFFDGLYGDARYSSYIQFVVNNLKATTKDSLIQYTDNKVNLTLINAKSSLIEAKSSLESKEKQINQLEEDNLVKQNELLKKEMLSQAKQKEIELLNKDKALQSLYLIQNQQALKQKELEVNKNEQELKIANQSKKINEEELARKNLELGHQIELKNQQEKELLLQTNLKNSLQKEAKQEQIIKWIFGGLAVLFILFGAFSFNRFLITRKQKKIIEFKSIETEEQKAIIEEKQKEILASIHYAKRIQQSLLPTEKYIERNLNELKKEK